MTHFPLSLVRRWRRSIVVLALLLSIVLWAGRYYAVKLGQGLVRGPNQGKQIGFATDPTAAELAALGVNRQLRVNVGPPAASLSVWVVDPQPPLVPWATVFVLHGINDTKDHQLARARRLVGEGYRAVVPDLRSHGRSTGDYLTYGVVESNDMMQLADALDRQGLVAGPIAAWGHSYGGATAIEWAARDKRVKVVISTDSFSSMSDIVNYLAPRYAPPLLGWASPIIAPWALRYAGHDAGFDPTEASPEQAATQTRAAILIIHAAGDTFVPPSQAVEISNNARGEHRLVILPGGEHNTVLDGEMADHAWIEVMPWLAGHLAENPSEPVQSAPVSHR